jgi:hypothetical protein
MARAEFDEAEEKRQSGTPCARPVQVNGQSAPEGPCHGLGLRPARCENRRGERGVEVARQAPAILAEAPRSQIGIKLAQGSSSPGRDLH